MNSKTNQQIDPFNTSNVASGRKLPNEKKMDEIGNQILAGEFTNFTYNVTGNPKLTVHFFARNDDVQAFLFPKDDLFETPIGKDEPCDYINLGNYDDALDSGSHGTRFFITADDPSRQWDILEAALNLAPSLNRVPDKLDYGEEIIQEQAELAINEAIANVHERFDTIPARKRLMNWLRGREHEPKFNAINDYGLPVTHVFVRDFLGLRLSKKRTFIFKFIQFVLSLFVRKEMRGKGLSGAANECYIWIGIIFYQLFINTASKNKFMVMLSKHVAKLYKRKILQSYEDPRAGSLLDRLKRIEPMARETPGKVFRELPAEIAEDFKNSSDQYNQKFDKFYRRKVVDIVMELAGSFQFLTGSAFSKMLESIEKWQEDHPNQEIKHDQLILEFIKDLNAHPRAMIDECLRHNTPTRFIYRKAKKAFTPKGHGGLVIEKGHIICLLTKQAMLDRKAFDCGESDAQCPHLNSRFLTREEATQHKDKFLTFGSPDVLPSADHAHQWPHEPHHPCFGQHWARIILQTMFNGLAQFENVQIIEPKPGKKRKFDEFNLSYDEPKESHNFVTILSAFEADEFTGAFPEDLIAKSSDQWRLDGLGVQSHIEVLKACKNLHYMSAHIVRGGDKREPDYLLIELSIDGGLSKSLDELTEHFGEELKGLYSRLKILKVDASISALKQKLFDDASELQQSSWPNLLSRKGINGLPFCGSNGLSADRIKQEANLAEFVSKRLRDQSQEEPEKPRFDKMRALRNEVFNDGLSKGSCPQSDKDMRWIFGGSKAPAFADSENDVWNKEKRGIGDRIKMGIGLVPPILILPIILIFLSMIALAEYLFGAPPKLADPSIYSAFPAEFWQENPRLGLFISARTLIIYGVIAVTFGSAISRLMRRYNILPGSRYGEFVLSSLVFSAIMTYAATRGLWGNSSPNSGVVFGNDPFPFLAMLLAVPFIISVLVYLRDSSANVLERRQAGAKAYALFAVLVLLIAMIAIHIKLFVLGGDQEGFSVYNRFNQASVFDLIFYPLVWGIMLMLTVLCYRHSYARVPPGMAALKNIGVIIFAAAIAFIGAYFPTPLIGTEETRYTALFYKKLSYLVSAVPMTLAATGFVAVWLWLDLRRSEKNNKPHDSAPNAEDVKNIMARENGTHEVNGTTPGAGGAQLQNHMISVQRLLPSQYRQRVLLPFSFQIIKRMLTTGIIRPGFLGNVGTVHYARWIHLPKTRNYVFLSNYDGSWESYLEDFIAKVWQGVNAAWSHCTGFPKAENLIFKGVQDGDRFKKWARGSMRPTPFWYSAYPDLSLEAIRRNALIRDGLVRARSSDEIEAWYRLFGAMPRQTHAIQSDQIQNIAFGGSPHLPYGACIILESANEADKFNPKNVREAFCAFVHDIKSQISFGQGKPSKRALYLAFGSAGLRALDHDDVLLQSGAWLGDHPAPNTAEPDGFSVPFQIGMHDPSRKSMLGDPDKLEWGQDGTILAAVIVHAIDDVTMKAITDKIDKYVLDSDGLRHSSIPFQTVDGKFQHREPFGFTDGVSNPIIRGTRSSTGQQDSIHMVEPGEFILGYKDNRGYYPPSPQVPAQEDPARILPTLPADQLLQYPKFASAKTPHLRDLGRNGSYLVIRQLEQDVKGFHDATGRIAAALMGISDEQLMETVSKKGDYNKAIKQAKKDHHQDIQNIVEAKLIGRWQDGSSLVNRPVDINDITNDKVDLPDTKPGPLSRDKLRQKNEFLFGRDDPQGHGCPYGSHIRRTNPRDSLDPNNSAGEVEIANRHRILRRGRTYEDKDGNKGTLFLCLNADLDRQFEFVQQTWMLGPDFHGLKGEYDPLANQPSKGFTVQCPGQAAYFGTEEEGGESGRNQLTQFVTLKGGGYFFMPGKATLEYLCFLGDGGGAH